jgi:hypothetical protein
VFQVGSCCSGSGGGRTRSVLRARPPMACSGPRLARWTLLCTHAPARHPYFSGLQTPAWRRVSYPSSLTSKAVWSDFLKIRAARGTTSRSIPDSTSILKRWAMIALGRDFAGSAVSRLASRSAPPSKLGSRSKSHDLLAVRRPSSLSWRTRGSGRRSISGAVGPACRARLSFVSSGSRLKLRARPANRTA